MNECDILGGQTYHDPSYIFSGGQDPQTPMIYASCRVVQSADLQIDVDPSPDNRQTARSVVGGRRRAAIIADWYRHDDVRSPPPRRFRPSQRGCDDDCRTARATMSCRVSVTEVIACLSNKCWAAAVINDVNYSGDNDRSTSSTIQ